MEDIRTFFKERPGREADFRELVHKKNDRYDTAVTFSSVLEMMKQQRLEARQHRLFGDIMVRATKRLMAEPDAGPAGDGANATEDTEVKEMENGQ